MNTVSLNASPLLQEWLIDLQTIDKELEASAQKILEYCDNLALQSTPNAPLQENLNGIVENCSFHDLNSQRLRKIVFEMQNAITTLQNSDAKYDEVFTARSQTEMSGPQPFDKALSQVDVESILNKN